jgi:PAS domain S-box-containing protein
MKILYIEDNPVDIDLTLRTFKKQAPHINVTTAKSQAQALKIIKKATFSTYDLVLTDMHLQDGDGIAVLSHIRGHSLPVAVVILTGQGDEEAAVSALKAGADDYVAKKGDYLDRLPDLLEAALASYCKTRDIGVQRLKVLYLEHNPADVDLTRRHLERHAPHIRMDAIFTVSDFYQQLNQPNSLTPYSALLLDYRLPQENALEIVKKIKAVTHSDIPVILVTGKGDEEIAVNALKLGVFDYVTKDQGYLFKLPSIVENAYYSKRLSLEHEALLESEKRYRSLFEDNHVAMLVIDPETSDIIDANPAAVAFYGWTHKELTAKSIHEINTLTTETLDLEISKAVKEKRIHFIFKHQIADGSIRDVEVFSSPIDMGGRSLLYSMIYDITQRLQAEREKEKLHNMLIQAKKMESFGQLAGGIAHDFNNLLSSIIGFTELALTETVKGSEMEDDLQEVYIAGKRAKELVSQILAFARQSDEEVKPIRISPIAKEVLKLIRSSTPSTIEIKHDINSNSYMLGNAVQIHQVIMNLCSNAVHAMEKDGGILRLDVKDVVTDSEIYLIGRTLKPGKYIALTVSDTGGGIPEENIRQIFEPYFTTKPLGEGTGMGLSMVYGIVESYNGRITVDSKLLKGTTFTIYLPMTDQRAETGHYESEHLQGGNETILFVDDEAPIAKMGQKILEDLGYSVTTMINSADALEHFRSIPESFDLVITDMTMPNLTGDALAAELMTIRPDIPVILCTGYSKKISDDSVADIGIRALIYKPVVKSDWAKTVRTVLDEGKS